MRRKVFLMSQVLGQPQEQAQLPPATVEALCWPCSETRAWRGERLLADWLVSCLRTPPPPFQGILNHTWEAQP